MDDRLRVAVAAVRPAEAVLHLLDAGERDRVRALPDADAAASAHALLRLLLAGLTGRAPHEHPLQRACATCGGTAHGRPHAAGAHVSLSRTPLLVAAAVTAAAPVGVDVELASRTGWAGWAGVVLGPGEEDGPPAQRARTWARKEALLKAEGRGLQADLRTVRPGPGVHVLDVPAPAGAACSVAVLRGPVVLEVLDGERLLSRAGPAGG